MMPEHGTIYQGDCLEVMRGWPDGCIDAVITDPPYDARTHKGAKCDSVAQTLACAGVSFASFGFEEQARLVHEALRLSRGWVLIFCTFEQIRDYVDAAGDAWVRTGVWDRVNPAPQLSGDRPAQACEAIAIMHRPGRKKWNGGGTAAIWRYSVEMGRKQHPTQKPESLMCHLVGLFSQPGDFICDPFAGSGSTLVAAERLGRRWCGIELNPEYVTIAKARTAQQGLFV